MTFSEDILKKQNAYFLQKYHDKEQFLSYLESQIRIMRQDLTNNEITKDKINLDISDIENILEQNEKSKDERIALIKKNIKPLKKLFFVDKVYIAGGKLSVLTKNLILEGSDFGRFVISIDPINYPIKFIAKSYKNYLKHRISLFSEHTRGKIYHPHVSGYGTVCLGDFENIVEKLMRNFDFESVFTIIWEILTTYNNESPYEPLENLVRLYNLGHYDTDTKANETV